MGTGLVPMFLLFPQDGTVDTPAAATDRHGVRVMLSDR